MTHTLILHISLPDTGSFLQEEDRDLEGQQVTVRHIKQGALHIRYQDGSYELLQGNTVIKLDEMESFSLGQLIINAQIEEKSVTADVSKLSMDTYSNTDVNDLIQMEPLLSEFWLTDFNKSEFSPEFDSLLNEPNKTDPLSFLYSTTPVALDKAKIDPSPIISETKSLLLLNQHFQAPPVQPESVPVTIIQTENIIFSNEKNLEGDVLRDLGFYDGELLHKTGT